MQADRTIRMAERHPPAVRAEDQAALHFGHGENRLATVQIPYAALVPGVVGHLRGGIARRQEVTVRAEQQARHGPAPLTPTPLPQGARGAFFPSPLGGEGWG